MENDLIIPLETASQVMVRTFNFLETNVPRPQLTIVNQRVGRVYRYIEKTPEQALILKLARLTSAVHGLITLLKAGLFQEQGAIQRIVDDTNEDVMFITLAIQRGKDEIHKKFFEAFWSEQFPDSEDTLARHIKPEFPPRSKIRAYIHRNTTLPGANLSLMADVGHSLSSTYSGYIHGAAPHIMDMYGGDMPRFYINGQTGLGREKSQIEDAANCVYRGLLSFLVACIVFGATELLDLLRKITDVFDKTFASTELPPELRRRL